MSADNLNVIWKTNSGDEHKMGQIITVEGELQFLPNPNIGPSFNAKDLRNIAAKLESLEQGAK
jgi:hypothetical protein